MVSKLIFCLTRLFLTVQAIIFLPTSIALNYCSLNVCNNSKQHTLCQFQTPGPGPNCFGYQKTITTQDDKKALLDKINSRRNKIAAGEVRSFPSAGNMRKLEWSEELERSAQRWADQCVGQGAHDTKDECRDLAGVAVGQNIASVYGEAPGLSPLSLVDVWYTEMLNANSSILPRYMPSSEAGFSHYEYFTQLVWARSSVLGCGGVRFQERLKDTQDSRNRTVHRLVCNFASGGNVLGENVYSSGPPCSRCPDGGTCDAEHKALCSIPINKKNRYTRTTIEKESTPTINTDDQFLLNEEQSKENITVIDVASSTDTTEDDENITLFDYFPQFNTITREPITISTTPVTNSCKDALAVDEFVELLKKKLTSDSMFKELLLSTKNPQNGIVDSTFSDPSVAAFVNRIYSKKEPPTTTKLPEYDYVNSTLLVDLVEAVIFRSAEKTFATEEAIESLQPSSVGPVKIQAELGEVKPNQDFTGHYFFPEDINEEFATEVSDSYYDSSDVPESDVISEIESIKRDKTTQDFLDEIIESDLAVDESTTIPHTISIGYTLNKNGHNVMNKFLDELGEREEKNE